MFAAREFAGGFLGGERSPVMVCGVSGGVLASLFSLYLGFRMRFWWLIGGWMASVSFVRSLVRSFVVVIGEAGGLMTSMMRCVGNLKKEKKCMNSGIIYPKGAS